MTDRADLVGLITARADKDPEFLDWLRQDPRAALSNLTGIDIPDFVEIVVHQDSVSRVHVVLPADLATQELSEADLEAVAGGSWASYAKAVEDHYKNDSTHV